MKKKIAIGLGAFVVLLIAAVLIGPSLIPADVYLSRVTEAVKQATGRDLTISGPVSVRLLPNIALEASQVSLSNAPGAAEPAMASIGKLEVGLKLIPLLSKHVEISRLDLTDPIIHLEIDKSGQGNWVFHPPAGAAPTPQPVKKSDAKTVDSQLQQLSLGTVKISNGTVSYSDARSGQREALTKLDASMTLNSIADPLSLSASGQLRGQTISVDIDANRPGVLLTGGTTTVKVKIDSSLLKMTVDGKLDSVGQAKAFTGKFDTSGPSLRNLMSWVATAPKITGQTLGAFSVSSNISLGSSLATLTNLNFALDKLKTTGSVTVATNGARPLIRGNLALGALDLNPYLVTSSTGAAAHPESAPIAAPAAVTSGWSHAPIDVSVLHTIDAGLTLALESLKFHNIEIGRSALVLALTNGRLQVDFRQIGIYGGNGTGRITVDGAGSNIGLQTDLTFANIQVQPLLSTVLGVDRFSGAGTMGISLSGHGANQSDLMQSLAGKASLHIANGAVKGLDLAAIVHNPASALTQDRNTAQTAFSALGGTFTITSGVASNNDLAMETGVGGVGGSGTIDVFRRTLDYRIVPHVASALQSGKSGIAGTDVPILIQGPWDHVSYKPDLGSVAQQKLQKAFGGKLDKALGKGAGAKAGGLLNGLLGGH